MAAFDAADSTVVTIAEARDLAIRHVEAAAGMTQLSAERFFAIWARFERFCDRYAEARVVSDISTEIVVAFIRARTPRGPAAGATQDLRRAALRHLFRIWRSFHLLDHEPTLDLAVPARRERTHRPLTDDEIDRCRWASLATLTATRQPAIWALAEAGVWPVEIASMTRANVDLTQGKVAIPEGVRTARVVDLTEWGAAQVGRHVARLEGQRRLVVADGTSEASARTSVAAVLAAILRRAGVAGEAVTQRSVVTWAGVRVLAAEGTIEDVARTLGVRSLDVAAALVGHEWQSR